MLKNLSQHHLRPRWRGVSVESKPRRVTAWSPRRTHDCASARCSTGTPSHESSAIEVHDPSDPALSASAPGDFRPVVTSNSHASPRELGASIRRAKRRHRIARPSRARILAHTESVPSRAPLPAFKIHRARAVVASRARHGDDSRATGKKGKKGKKGQQGHQGNRDRFMSHDSSKRQPTRAHVVHLAKRSSAERARPFEGPRAISRRGGG